MEQMAINVIVFVSVMMLFWGMKVALLRTSSNPDQMASAEQGLPLFFSVFGTEINTVGSVFGGNGDSPSSRRLSGLIALATLPLTVMMVRGAQILAALMGGALFLLVTLLVTYDPVRSMIGLIVGCAVGCYLPLAWVRRYAEERKLAISRELPFAIDLVTVSMQAGQEFGAAVRQVVKESGKKSALANEFAVMLKEVELGKTRIDALKTMASRIQLEEFMGLVSAVEQGTEMGASISKTLQIQAEEMRRLRYHRAERKAARAPSLMILPMVIFILPSIFIIIFVPMLIRLSETGFFKAMGG